MRATGRKFQVGQVVYWKKRRAHVRISSAWSDAGLTRYNIMADIIAEQMVLTSQWDVAESELRPLTKKEAGR